MSRTLPTPTRFVGSRAGADRVGERSAGVGPFGEDDFGVEARRERSGFSPREWGGAPMAVDRPRVRVRPQARHRLAANADTTANADTRSDGDGTTVVRLGRAHERSVARSLAFAQGRTRSGRRLPLACEDPRHALLLAGRGDYDDSFDTFDAYASGDVDSFSDDDGDPGDGGARGARFAPAWSVTSVRPQRDARVTAWAADREPLAGARHLLGEALRDTPSVRVGAANRSDGPAGRRASQSASIRPDTRWRTSDTSAPRTVGNVALAVDAEAGRSDVLAASRPRLSLVRGGRMWTARRVIACGAIAVALVLFFAVALHAVLAEAQVGLDQRAAGIAAAERLHDRLRVDVARLEAPDRIASQARRLGLTVPVSVRFVPSAASPGGLTVIDVSVPGAVGQ